MNKKHQQKKWLNYKLLIGLVLASMVGTLLSKTLRTSEPTTITPIENTQTTLEQQKQWFLDGCISGDGTEELCSCVFEKLITEYGLEQYMLEAKNNSPAFNAKLLEKTAICRNEE
ncbi:hypothetical protein KO465_10070 [Candidatus Micrarchaeota archaeon]|nr:hypothetical protein [Candidatus Micrarchaeota archaeon]